MKTIVEINNNNYGSTGKIMNNIACIARNNGYQVFTCCKNSKESHKYNYSNQIFVGIWLERVISEKLSYITGYKDCFNVFGTLLFIRKLNQIKPDLLHLHNIHGSFINIKLLFNYIKKNNIPIVWTFHDTWPFTGQCTYFDLVNCDKWKYGCNKCPKLNEYPSSKSDKTDLLWHMKRELFCAINNFTIVTPSNWLLSLTKESFLHNKKALVINNGIDLQQYKPMNSDFVDKYNLKDKYLILGVAYDWSERKGLNVLIKLSKELPDNYKIILVGTNDTIDKAIPSNIISIHKTNTKEDLIKIYTCVDLFINPTKEENFPTVNIEALACGTPVLTFDTGGSKEIIDEKCGSYVRKDDYESLYKEIIRICETNPYTKDACINRAKLYDMNLKFNEYINLFDTITK